MAPTVTQRSSSSKVESGCVMAKGSSKTRAAVSKRTSCLRRFCRLLFSSHSNRITGGDKDRVSIKITGVNTFVRTSPRDDSDTHDTDSVRSMEEKSVAYKTGGEGGSRTHEPGFARLPAFEAGSFDHSDTSPRWQSHSNGGAVAGQRQRWWEKDQHGER